MIQGMGLLRRAVTRGVVLVSLVLALGIPATAFAEAPHVATTPTPDTCSMCHRAHTAPADFGRIDADSWEMTSSALAIAVPVAEGDTALCYVCHGVDALGSGTPIGGDFAETSIHTLAPTASPFGPSVKYCSNCHDSHGAAESAPGIPYAKLLRARTESGTAVYRDSEYCGTCHEVRVESRFPGVTVYEQTAHYGSLPNPASGTLIRCSICHEEHGSAIAPLVISEVTPPSVTATETVTANDRTFCFTCHPDESGVYPGEDDYDDSAHGSSDATTTIPGEWPADDAERLVGECQVCHAPMGRDDGDGAPIPTLLEAEYTALCLSCHDTDGPAETDASPLLYPDTAATQLEIVAGFSAETTTVIFSTVAVWGTDAADTAPRDLVGPRFYESAVGTSGILAVGDIDGVDGQNVVVADQSSNKLFLFAPDALKGLSSYLFEPGWIAIGGIADFLAIADVIDDASNRPEICVIVGDTLYVYRYDIVGNPLESVGSVSGLGADITGLAAGDLDADGVAELVVTDADAPEIHIIDGGTGSLVATTRAAKAGVRGPSIGDVDTAPGIEFAVANADEVTDQVTVYDDEGNEIDSASLSGAGTAKAWDTLIADVLPGSVPAGDELVVAANGAEGDSHVLTFLQAVGGGIGTSASYLTGPGYGTGSLAAGDIDGDTYAELIVGNGGYWSRVITEAAPPSVQVFNHNAGQTAFDTTLTETLHAGGVERAGAAPTLAVADLGGVGPSRHPVGVREDAHEVDEAAPVLRHVECVDCHNSHEATSTVGIAPAAYGRILGTNGATAALVAAEPVTNEYELCYKCHSAYQDEAGLEGSSDISALFDAGNASMHAVEQAQTTTINVETFEDSWDEDSVLYCIDCHATAEATPEVAGPHSSAEAPILRSPYLGVAPSNMDGLCYDCHKYAVYYTGADDTVAATGSAFRNGAVVLHNLHVADHGFGCAACHDTHGVEDNERLIRDTIDFDAATRTCEGACHPLGITYTP
ncbi:MAG: cytochrome c3 family protein [Coriobacteriia bacterium]|nr:cytochrome c3 family protein [Coriobacteriia bacterium]